MLLATRTRYNLRSSARASRYTPRIFFVSLIRPGVFRFTLFYRQIYNSPPPVSDDEPSRVQARNPRHFWHGRNANRRVCHVDLLLRTSYTCFDLRRTRIYIYFFYIAFWWSFRSVVYTLSFAVSSSLAVTVFSQPSRSFGGLASVYFAIFSISVRVYPPAPFCRSTY